MQHPGSMLTVTVFIKASKEQVWACWTEPQHILQWNKPADHWHTTEARNDVRNGGAFLFAMRAKDGSAGFDFSGIYDEVIRYEKISYTTTDGRRTSNLFQTKNGGVELTEIFEPEQGRPAEQQREFCAGVLGNFKAYTEQQRPA